MESMRLKLWDLPTRLFHWLLVVLMVAVVITGKIGGNTIVWHGWLGLAILGLTVFRLIWGFVGSTYARFFNFIPAPSALLAYLRGQWHGIGHNPLGAFSVLGLLGLTALQAGTGLFSNDEIAFQGPLYNLVSSDLGITFTRIHRIAINALLALIILHVTAIVFYTHIKKEKLVGPMITGWTELAPGQHGKPATGGGFVAFIVALTIALAAVYGASGAWISAPPPPAPANTAPAPAW